MGDLKFSRSPIPQGGLETPIDLPDKFFKMLKEFIDGYYLEPGKIPTTKNLRRT